MLEKTTGEGFGNYEMTFKGYLAGQCVAHSLSLFVRVSNLYSYHIIAFLHFKWPHLKKVYQLH